MVHYLLSTRARLSFLGCLVVIAATRTAALSLSSNAGYVVNGYVDEALATLLGLGSTFCAALAAIAFVVHLVNRQLRAIASSLLLLLIAVTLLLWATVWVGRVGTKWPYSTVYSSKRNVYYVLCDALVPTDTVFEVAQTPSLWRPLWRRSFDSSILEYSEDGSLISDPRLILSGDQSILVISRGGQLTDAVDLDRSKNLVGTVDWSHPGRERAWAMRTGQVNDILRTHDDGQRR